MYKQSNYQELPENLSKGILNHSTINVNILMYILNMAKLVLEFKLKKYKIRWTFIKKQDRGYSDTKACNAQLEKASLLISFCY